MISHVLSQSSEARHIDASVKNRQKRQFAEQKDGWNSVISDVWIGSQEEPSEGPLQGYKKEYTKLRRNQSLDGMNLSKKNTPHRQFLFRSDQGLRGLAGDGCGQGWNPEHEYTQTRVRQDYGSFRRC